MPYDYIQENYEDVSSIERNLLIFNVSKDSLEAGIKAAQIALNDIGVKETMPGSKTGTRVDQYLQNVGCRPTLGEWASGAIATWFKEAGLPIPPKDSSSATGWYVWAKKTNRWFETPVIGSVAVYGTEEYNYDTDTKVYNVHHLGLVIQVEEEDNTVVTCENINGEISQAIADIDSLLGFIIPSKTDIKTPEITFKEPIDESKENNLNESTEYTTAPVKTKNSTNKLGEFIRDVVRKVLINGDTKENCANGTYNHARQFVRSLLGKQIIPGRPVHSGGNAKQSGYHRELEKLGYKRTDFGTISHKELKKYLNNSNNWNIGDVAVYWTETPYFSDCNCYKYGHTQIFTGGYQGDNNQFKWATDNKRNYRTACVYSNQDKSGKVFSYGTWRFIKFTAPDI